MSNGPAHRCSGCISSFCSDVQFAILCFVAWNEEAFSLLTSPYASACPHVPSHQVCSVADLNRCALCDAGQVFVLFCRTHKFVLWAVYSAGGEVPDDQTTEPLLYGSLALKPFQKRQKRRARMHSALSLSQTSNSVFRSWHRNPRS